MIDHRTVLALDLSSTRGVIAVQRGGVVIYESSFTAERSHNAQVFAPLGAALAAIGDGPAAVVIGTGPGSYTGVRIAIAAAQGISLSRGWPVIGWPSITTAAPADYRIIGDARRGMYYLASVSHHWLGSVEIVDAATAQARVETGGDWFTYDAHIPLGLAPVRACQPDAAALAHIAAQLSDAEVETRALLPLEPVYLQGAFITTSKKAGKQVTQLRPLTGGV